MEILRAGSRPSGKGPAEWFTGTVRIDPLFAPAAPARGAGNAVTFEPGARTAWHTHPLGQVLIVVALTSLVLMHSGRDAGMGGMGFTPASQGGTHIVERNLTRVTVVLTVLFFANSIALFHYLK